MVIGWYIGIPVTYVGLLVGSATDKAIARTQKSEFLYWQVQKFSAPKINYSKNLTFIPLSH